ncbi:SMC-Scp complex subunit ScpB [Candidatus Woesearchaeota archaeon]|nr:SMC-Scp complex subunit ScpB [Candidatus Woesearchaeota archaeon]
MQELTDELKKKVESILFAAGKKVDITEIAKLCRLIHNPSLVEKVLKELKEKFDSENSSLMLVQEGTAWKLTVREKYASLVQNLVTQSELSKTIMETLAVIAYKSPVLQSEIIRIRTNKAYDHLRELEESGYITREKKGRTKLIKLSPKFFEYFDVPPEKLKERFKTVEELEKAVELKEEEASELKQESKAKKTESKRAEEEIRKSEEKEMEELEKNIKEKEEKIPEVDLVDKKGRKKKLETYDSEIAEGTELEKPKSNLEMVEEKLGKLDVVEVGLPGEEKKHLIEEAEELKKEDMIEEAKKKGRAKEEAESKKKEKEFEEKFKLYKEGEEKEAPEEEKEEPEEETAPEEGPKEEEQPELEEKEEEPEEEKEEKEEKEEPEEERITTSKLAEEAAEQRTKTPVKKREGKMLFEKGVPKDVQEKIDRRVDEIVFGKEEEKPEPEEKTEEGEETEKTPEGY